MWRLSRVRTLNRVPFARAHHHRGCLHNSSGARGNAKPKPCVKCDGKGWTITTTPVRIYQTSRISRTDSVVVDGSFSVWPIPVNLPRVSGGRGKIAREGPVCHLHGIL